MHFEYHLENYQFLEIAFRLKSLKCEKRNVLSSEKTEKGI